MKKANKTRIEMFCKFAEMITYVEFQTLQLYNFVKPELNAKKLCSRVFLHKIKNTP